MKRYINKSFVLVLCFLVLTFTSCENSSGEDTVNNKFYNEYTKDDEGDLEDILTHEYPLNDLKAFFEGYNANENVVLQPTASVLTWKEVNEKYPIEIVRSGGYSVYKVSQGGYYYVFWIKPVVEGIESSSVEPNVYFSAYLSSSLSLCSFDSLTPGNSTARDVKNIDPAFELSFLASSGVCSYSCLNNDMVLQIVYTHSECLNDYDDLIVKEIKIVPRAFAPARYSKVLTKDIPYV